MLGTICCLGGSNSGGLLCSVIAFKCPEIKVDVFDTEKIISKWNTSSNPIDEPGLDKILTKCRNRNLFFTSNYTSLKHADLVFVSIDLPVKKKGTGEGKTLDIKPLEDAARFIAAQGETDKIIVENSTVPRAAESMTTLLNMNARNGVRYQVLSSPEFCGQFPAVEKLLNIDRVVIGCSNNPAGRAAAESLSWVYEHWVPRKNIIILNIWSATITKLAMTAFLIQKLTSVNTLTEICEKTGADISEISALVSEDERIGPKYLTPSLGLSGVKGEVSNFLFLCDYLKLPEIIDYWQAVLDYSDYHRKRFIDKISNILSPLANKKIAIWGFSCKFNPRSTIESPAIDICKFLLMQGAKIKIYDPTIDRQTILSDLSEWKGIAEKTISISDDPYEATVDTTAIVVCNDWNELKELTYPTIYDKMRRPSIIVDGHKCLEGPTLRKCGFLYYTIGADGCLSNSPD